MKTKLKIWIYQFTLLVFVLIFSYSCNPNDNNTPTPTPPPPAGPIAGPNATDIDGNVYHSVIIGTQTWMVENLKTTKYSNGDLIGTTTPATLDISGESTPKYQWAYNGNESNVAVYGRLYTEHAVSDSRNVCPTGWHVSTNNEWSILSDYLGVEAGYKLKESGTTHWSTPNSASNETGFTALPGGLRIYAGSFISVGIYGYWWAINTNDASGWGLTYISSYITYSTGDWAYSVRCVKN